MKKHKNSTQGSGRGQAISYSSTYSYCPECGKYTPRATSGSGRRPMAVTNQRAMAIYIIIQ